MKTMILPMAVALILWPSLLDAEELQTIPTDQARKWAERLAEQVAKIKNPQVSIQADADKANGIHVPDKLGILIVPQKDLTESEELAAKFQTETGAPLACLFTYRIVPIINGKRVDGERLRQVRVTDAEGTEHTVYVLLLAVRQLAEDDYRLYGYGDGKQPLVDAKFSQGTGPGPEPVAVEVKDPDGQTREGTLVVTVFGKYQASFRAGYQDG